MAKDTPIIPDRAEFIDALKALQRGHVLVRVHDRPGGCLLDGASVYWSFSTLLAYGLIQEFSNREGFAQVQYYRLSEQGRQFAERACQAWRQRPVLERLVLRVMG